MAFLRCADNGKLLEQHWNNSAVGSLQLVRFCVFSISHVANMCVWKFMRAVQWRTEVSEWGLAG